MPMTALRFGVVLLLAGCHAAPTASPRMPETAGPTTIAAEAAQEPPPPPPRTVRSPAAVFEDVDALEGDPMPQSLADEVEALRYNARLGATGEDPTRMPDVDARAASVALQARARAAKDIDDLIHPERGLFILSYDSDGIRMISLDHYARWVSITTEGFGADVDGQGLLQALRSAASLPTEEARTDDECRFQLDAVVPTTTNVLESWASMTSISDDDPVEDGFALRPWAPRRGYEDDEVGFGLDRETFEAMQRTAFSVTHTVYWDTQKFDFGRIEGTWYLLGVEILVDINEAC